jgi:hypothetical protein
MKRYRQILIMVVGLMLIACPVFAFRTTTQMLLDYNRDLFQPTLETTATNTVQPSLRLIHTTTGTPASGLGEAMQFYQQTSAAGNMEIGGSIDLVSTDLTGSSEDFDFVFNLMQNGATAAEKFRIKSDGSFVYTGPITTTVENLTADTNQIVLDSNGTFTLTLTASPSGSSKVVTIPNTTGTLYISSGTDISLADGGTNASLTAVAGGIAYGTAGALALTAVGTTGQLLQSNAAGTPTWISDILTSTTIGGAYVYRAAGTDISLTDGGTNASLTAVAGGIAYSGAASLALTAVGTTGQLLQSNAAGVPTWVSDILTSTTIGSAYIYRAGGTDVPITDGGTGVSSWTNGQLLIGNTAGNTAALGTLTGTSNQITVTNGASSITLSTPQSIDTAAKVEFKQIKQSDFEWKDEFVVVDAPQWTTRTTTGAVAIQGAVNGTERMTSGALNTNEESLDWNDLCPFINTQRPTIEFGVALEQVTALEVDLGFMESAGVGTDDYILMKFNASGANTWSLTASKAGTAASDTGAVATTGFHTYRIAWLTDTSVEWFIDGVSQGTIATDINIPVVLMQPVIAVRTEEAGAHYIDVDVVRIWQDRE